MKDTDEERNPRNRKEHQGRNCEFSENNQDVRKHVCRIQQMIDHSENHQRMMLEIGKWYLEGTVLKDFTAAEAWLTRAMNMEENALSVQAMELIGHRITGKVQILTDEDYRTIQKRLSDAPEEESEYLRALEKLGREERRKQSV